VSDEKVPAEVTAEAPATAAQERGPARATRSDGMPVGRPFAPGNKANPGAMTAAHRAILDDFRDKARRYSPEAFRHLVDIVEGRYRLPGGVSEDHEDDHEDARGEVIRPLLVETKDRLKALEMLLDRAWGRPAQPVVGEEGAPPVGGLTSADMRQTLAQALATAIATAKAVQATADGNDDPER
jgi:hypothetical protein